MTLESLSAKDRAKLANFVNDLQRSHEVETEAKQNEIAERISASLEFGMIEAIEALREIVTDKTQDTHNRITSAIAIIGLTLPDLKKREFY